MDIGNRIKEHRNQFNLSQEELADMIFVSRQTISNWENNKFYPDIKSISLLCDIFNVSINDFIEEDSEEMKKIIEENDVKGFNILSWIFTVELFVMIFSAYPLLKYAHITGIALWILFAIITLCTAFTIEKIKKYYDIQTYKEIIAFCENKTLRRDDKLKEIGKRPYQKFLLAISCGSIAIIVMLLMCIILN